MVSRCWWSMVLVVVPAVAQQQEEAPQLVIDDLGKHERLDPDLRSLHLSVASPAELARLAEAPALQWLQVAARGSPGAHAEMDEAWAEAGPDLLAPLEKLRDLRWLEVGYFHGCDPRVLRVVGWLHRLEELHVIGTCHTVDDAAVGQWMKLPLRRLELIAVGFDDGAFASLCRLPVLERLQLDLPLGLRAADVAHLAQLRQVRELSLRCWGHDMHLGMESLRRAAAGAATPADDQPEPMTTPDGLHWRRRLGAVAGQALGQLKLLRELNCSSSVLGEGFLGALPNGLTKLDLTRCVGLTAAELGKLGRLTALRHLLVDGQPKFVLQGLDGADAAAIDAALAALLPKLALEELTLEAPAGPLLPPALARCTTLRKVHVRNLELYQTVRALVGEGVTVTQ